MALDKDEGNVKRRLILCGSTGNLVSLVEDQSFCHSLHQLSAFDKTSILASTLL
jgi:hypothetical protein